MWENKTNKSRTSLVYHKQIDDQRSLGSAKPIRIPCPMKLRMKLSSLVISQKKHPIPEIHLSEFFQLSRHPNHQEYHQDLSSEATSGAMPKIMHLFLCVRPQLDHTLFHRPTDVLILLMEDIPNNHLRCLKNKTVNNGINYIPTSTGEFTGFLNHQQYQWLQTNQTNPRYSKPSSSSTHIRVKGYSHERSASAG